MSDITSPNIDTTETVWVPPRGRDLMRWPLASQHMLDRLLMRGLAALARRHVLSVTGVQNIGPELDPFILAANHTSRREAIYLPAVLTLLRRGRLIHFLGDWNFRLYPGINFLYRRSGTITVSRKPAKYRPLDRFKPLYAEPAGALQCARVNLSEGRSIGIFPEGTVNRQPDRLLAGHPGAAFLSLRMNVPVVPVGISLIDEPLPSGRHGIAVSIGAPLRPDRSAGSVTRAEIAVWHATIMKQIAVLSGRDWSPDKRATSDDKAG